MMNATEICNNCQAAFIPPKSVSGYAEQVSTSLLGCHQQCNCETQSVSSFSPCPVDNSEEIAACATHEYHYDNKSNILTHKVSDRAFTQGLSVTRMKYKDDPITCTLTFCEKIDSRKKLKSAGLVVFQASTARSIKFAHDDSRAFMVYDTALSKDHAHGDVMASALFRDLTLEQQLARAEAQTELLKGMRHIPEQP